MTAGSRGRRAIAPLVAALLVLAVLPGVAAAETRSGGTVVVAEGETVDGLTAYAGTVIVRGTVEGDLEAYAGNVFVEGTVTGDAMAFAGNVRIAGEVGGSVRAAGGNVFVERGAAVGGDLEASGGTVVVAGTVDGNARLAGGSVTLAPTATVGGDVRYDAEDGAFTNEGATVGGTIRRDPGLETGGPSPPALPGWAFDLYGVLANLALGAVLLLALPGVSGRVAARVAAEPLRTAAVGLLALIAVPVALVALAVTIVGLPLAIVGGLLFVPLAWVAAVYGRFAVGTWAASRAGIESRWVGLLAGVVGIAALKAALGAVPLLGWTGSLLELATFLLGLGALAALGYGAVRRRREGDAAEGTGTSAA